MFVHFTYSAGMELQSRSHAQVVLMSVLEPTRYILRHGIAV